MSNIENARQQYERVCGDLPIPTACLVYIRALEAEIVRLAASRNTFGPLKRLDYVRKKSGSWWEGFVVGGYSTEQTPDGVCVQLDKPMGPVQIYPASALELVAKEEGI